MLPSVDSHAHVLDPERFPYAADAKYHPQGQEIGTLERYLAVLDAHGIGRGLLVQPTSGYAYDNRCMLDATERSRGRLRAIVRLPPGESRAAAERQLDHPSVAGLRLDLIAEGAARAEAGDTAWIFDALAERGKTLQVQCEGDQLSDALPSLRKFKGAMVIDHCGRPVPERGLQQRGFQSLLELGSEGHFVKLSGPFRFSRERFPFADCEPYVEAILSRFTAARCVWGSDWPYLRLAGRLDYGPGLAALERWVADPAARERVLREVPMRLFGFT